MIINNIGSIQNLTELQKTPKDTKEFLKSLKEAKYKILNLLPESSDGMYESVTTPTRSSRDLYEDENLVDLDDVRMIKLVYEEEADQMKFVQESISDKGLPEDIENSLKKILELYQNITDQIFRAKQTNQISALNI